MRVIVSGLEITIMTEMSELQSQAWQVLGQRVGLTLVVIFLSKQIQPSDQTLLGGKIAVFTVELVVFKSEECEFGALFVAIGRFFEDQHVLSLGCSGRTHDALYLCLSHAVGDLVVIGQGKLRAG